MRDSIEIKGMHLTIVFFRMVFFGFENYSGTFKLRRLAVVGIIACIYF